MATSRTRTEHRNRLRAQLRDTATAPNQIWTDEQLNAAIVEAWGLTQASYPRVENTRANAAVNAETLAVGLPVDAIGVDRVLVQRTGEERWTQFTDWQALQGVAAGGTDPIQWASGAYNQLNIWLFGPWATGDGYLIYYRAHDVGWGDPATSSLDGIAKDLAPQEQDDSIPLVLFQAQARCAALRSASFILDAGGGRDFAAEYQSAQLELDSLLKRTPTPRGEIGFTNDFFDNRIERYRIF